MSNLSVSENPPPLVSLVGHQRLKVLIDTGITEVECVIVEMDADKEKALNVALNKISGEWDNDKLALLISDLQGADFDVSLTGFEAEELEDLFREDTKKCVQDDNFDVDAELAKPTFSKAGDLWLLGMIIVLSVVIPQSLRPMSF